MPNAVDDALARMNAEQREQTQKTIDEARANIRLVSMQPGDMSPTAADSVARNAQIIEEAKRTIPFETMKTVDEIGPPLNTPPTTGYYQSNVVDLHPHFQSTIETIEQGPGNNYLRENAVDRAMDRPSQQMPDRDQQQAISR